ncbi:MAG TPA: amino acid adenylation domain-containing protein [Jatrophihabitans sp.]|jgi:amino acid adenylation domain-containing protein|uniref:non-ribosomal peptide synthetase n=1 Tax=Jatrophihabitans sp. TaxID=1932789 RepID=UPI002F1D6DD7
MTLDTDRNLSDLGDGRTQAETGLPLRPLSFGQEQLWFIDQLAPGQTTYNILQSWRVQGPLDIDILRRCLTLVITRHEVLRVTIQTEDGTPYQVVSPPAPVELPILDLRPLPEAEREQGLQSALREQLTVPFDLKTGPLYRFQLFQLADEQYVLCQGYHHIVTDGWSSAIINSEISATYRALLEGDDPQLDDPEVSYLDYAQSQRERLQGEALEEELAFWQERLAGLPVLELPTDRPRPVGGDHRGDSVLSPFPPGLREAAQQLADEHGASLFMVLATALAVVLSRYSGQEDIPIGVPMLGRPEPELEDVVGLFINMVVLRSDLSGDPSFAELLDRVADLNLDLYEHQEVPFHQVVDRVQPVRDPDRNPLFQVAAQLLGGATSGESLSLPGVSADYLLLASVSARFDLALTFIDTPAGLLTGVEYSTALFDEWRIKAMLGHVESVLRTATADPALRLSQIPVVTEDEKAELLAVGRGEVVAYNELPLHAAVAAVAARTPDAVALVCNGVELSYGEFVRQAGQLARYLRSLGLRREQVIAVVIDRDLDAYVTMLGILMAGATFTMLDPKLPANRLAFMIGDTAAPIVITRSDLADRLPEPTGWQRVLIDADWPAIEAMPADEPLEEWSTADSLAYILYTSGSTGTPKGVMIAHRAVSLFAEGYRRTYDFGPQDRLLQLPSLSFDMSQGELWTGFLVGATVVAVGAEEALSPEGLMTLMREQRVSYAGLPPAILSVLEAEPYPNLKYVMGGAEVLPPELVNKWNLPGRTFVNLYGPTEAAIACTEYKCPHIDWQTSPPIGRPQVNRQVYVVDQRQNLVPKGVPGELLIGGEDGGLAQGYLNQPELTAEKFIADPYHPGRLVYRSGDLVRWNEDLQIEFIGRVDNQVKLRGLRIELGEIEGALLTHPDVGRSVVLLRPDPQGENRLVGYVTASGQRPPVPQELRAHLGGLLPDYMVPTAWVVLEEFPLSGGWKIDRKALPDPVEQELSEDAFVAPANATEETVAQVFSDVLSVPKVSAQDGFFAIGGNSLQAMRVVSRINKAFGIKINIRLLYGNATVSAISAVIEEKVQPTS